MGIAAPDDLWEELAGPGATVLGVIVVDAAGCPLVNGTSLAELALKPGAPVVALGAGPDVLFGLRTLYSHSLARAQLICDGAQREAQGCWGLRTCR